MDASLLVCTSVFSSLSRHLWCFSIVGRVNASSMTMAAVTLRSVHTVSTFQMMQHVCASCVSALTPLMSIMSVAAPMCIGFVRITATPFPIRVAQAISTRVQRCFHHELRAYVWQVFHTLDAHDSDASRIDQLLEPRPLDFQVSGAFQASSRRHGDRA